MEHEIIHDQKDHKFYTVIDGNEAHLAYNMVKEDAINFHHTYVPPPHRGKGIAAELVKYGLDFARQKNYTVIPSCSYVGNFLRQHPEYDELTE